MGANIKAKIKVTLTHHLTNSPFPPFVSLSNLYLSEVFDYNFPKFEIDVFSIFFYPGLGSAESQPAGPWS